MPNYHNMPGAADEPSPEERAAEAGETTEQRCRACGCTEGNACRVDPPLDQERGCYWVEEDLCSACHDDHDAKFRVHGPLKFDDQAATCSAFARWARLAEPGMEIFCQGCSRRKYSRTMDVLNRRLEHQGWKVTINGPMCATCQPGETPQAWTPAPLEGGEDATEDMNVAQLRCATVGCEAYFMLKTTGDNVEENLEEAAVAQGWYQAVSFAPLSWVCPEHAADLATRSSLPATAPPEEAP